MHALKLQLNGSAAKAEVGEKEQLTIRTESTLLLVDSLVTSYGQTKLIQKVMTWLKPCLTKYNLKWNSFPKLKFLLSQKIGSQWAPVVLD